MEDYTNEDDPNTNPQVTKNFFIRTEYVFHLNSTNKKFDKFIAIALTNTKAYESYVNKINHFALKVQTPCI